MYKRILCSLTAIFLLSLLLLCISCKQQPSPPPSTVPLPGPTSPESLEITAIYTNTEYNYSFSFSDREFELFENYPGFNVVLLGPLLWDMNSHINIVIMISELLKKISLDDFVKDDIKKGKYLLEDYEVVDQYSSVVGGLPSEIVVFTFSKEVGGEVAKYKDIAATFMKDNNVYIIKYNVPEEFHEEYLPYFNAVLSTFKFDSN